MSASDHSSDFEAVKNRLAEIAEAVDDESLSLDDALGLYEEAVALGLQASDLLETGIVVPDNPDEAAAQQAGSAEGAVESSAEDAAQDAAGDAAAHSEPEDRPAAQ